MKHQSHEMMEMEEMLMKKRRQMNLGEEHFNKWIPALFLTCICRQH